MIDGSEKRNRQLAFELQNSHVCEKRSKVWFMSLVDQLKARSVLNFQALSLSVPSGMHPQHREMGTPRNRLGFHLGGQDMMQMSKLLGQIESLMLICWLNRENH